MKEDYQHPNSPKENSGAALNKIILPTVLIIAVMIVLYLAKDTAITSEVKSHNKLLETVVSYAIVGCEVASVIVIVSSVIHSLISYVKRLFHRDFQVQIRSSESIRLRLGHRLSLALEFAMAADILGLAISPGFAELLSLFIIILLRVLITIFLEYDIETSMHYHMLPGTDWLNFIPDEEIRKDDSE